MQLSEIGKYLTEIIERTPEHCPYCQIPLFVVMPNHWHAIAFIDGEKIPKKTTNAECRDVACHVSTNEPLSINEKMKHIRSQQGWLSVAIGGIKSAVTKFAREHSIEFAWQERFHDVIIRDQEMMNRVAYYVENNIARWDEDCFNTPIE
ncbi:MAG: transposase [Prevotellaceae bacterium]|jgi:REP element-mobilizing transposase RayT|nr:transposase [Prevotellaceae bacterium]